MLPIYWIIFSLFIRERREGISTSLRVPNPSSQLDFCPNPSYQICNPISSARLLTDVHHEVKALIDAIWIMNLHSPGLNKITHPAGEYSSSSNPC